MIKQEEIQVTKKVEVAIICDVCKKEFKNIPENIPETQEFHQIRFTGGFASVFGDMSTFELDICQHCLKNKLGEYIREAESNE
jgi:hypothetical protein